MNDSSGPPPLDGPTIERLLDEYLPGLRAFVRLRTGPALRMRETESDIVQSTCREVLQRADRFRHGGETGFRSWLYTTALRKILNKHEFHTAAKRDVRREAAAEAELLGAYGSFCSPSRLAAAREEIEHIEQAFDGLSEEHREVVLLSRLVGLSRAEVARQMDRSETSVRSLLHRALARLAELIETRPA